MSRDSLPFGAISPLLVTVLLVVRCAAAGDATVRPQKSVSEQRPASGNDWIREGTFLTQELQLPHRTLGLLQAKRQWKQQAMPMERLVNSIALQRTAVGQWSKIAWAPFRLSAQSSELLYSRARGLFESARKRLKRQKAVPNAPAEISPQISCNQQGRQAVFGVDVSTFGPSSGCLRDAMRCIEQKRDECLSRALVSGDLAMYCPKLRGAKKGNCAESFLTSRCVSHARSCLRDCRGIARSRLQFQAACREGDAGQTCKLYTLFHQQRIQTQDICVPHHCDVRTISDSLAVHYGRKRRLQMNRSMPAQAMDDMIVCGGGAGELKHVVSANRAIDTYQQTSMANHDASQPAQPQGAQAFSTASGLATSRLPLHVALMMPVILCVRWPV